MDEAKAPRKPTCLVGTILDEDSSINELPAAAAPHGREGGGNPIEEFSV